MKVGLLQYRLSPVSASISVEHQLDSLDIAFDVLSLAQKDPTLSTILHGPSLGTEDGLGAKISEGAKKFWAALVAFFKRLLGWGKSTVEEAKEVVAEIKSLEHKKINISESQQKQHRDLVDALASARTYDEVLSKLTESKDLCPDLPYGKLNELVKRHYRYYGHYLFGNFSGDEFNVILDAISEFYSSNGDHEKFYDAVFPILDNSLRGEIPNGAVVVQDYVGVLAEKVKEFDVKAKPFSTGKSAFLTDLPELRKDFEKNLKVLSGYDDALEQLKSKMLEAEQGANRTELAALRVSFQLSRIYVSYVDDNLKYLRAVIAYREHFEVE